MKRCVALALLAGLFVWTGAALAEDAITIKMKRAGEGESTLEEKTTSESSAAKIVDGDGKVLMENKESKVTTQAYKETILKREGNKSPTKLEREYTKAEVKMNDKTETLPYQGKTVVIEKKDDKYTFTYKGGKELTAEESKDLAKEFAAGKPDSEALEKMMLPKGAVKAGDTWKLDKKALAKEFAKEGGVEFDDTKAVATGKLVKAYKKDGKQFGAMEIKLELPVKSIGKGDDKLTFKEGAKFVMEFTIDGCIDGTSGVGSMSAKVNMSGVATHPKLPGGSVTLTTMGTEKGETKEPARK